MLWRLYGLFVRHQEKLKWGHDISSAAVEEGIFSFCKMMETDPGRKKNPAFIIAGGKNHWPDYLVGFRYILRFHFFCLLNVKCVERVCFYIYFCSWYCCPQLYFLPWRGENGTDVMQHSSNGAAPPHSCLLTLESIYPESLCRVYTPGPPWPRAACCVALMSTTESPQIPLVFLSASFPPFVAARHVFGSTNLVNLSASDVWGGVR